MSLGHEVAKRKIVSFLSQPILKFWSLEIDKEMKNVNKRGQEVTKHIEL
jgi:hypothetical protein